MTIISDGKTIFMQFFDFLFFKHKTRLLDRKIFVCGPTATMPVLLEITFNVD